MQCNVFISFYVTSRLRKHHYIILNQSNVALPWSLFPSKKLTWNRPVRFFGTRDQGGEHTHTHTHTRTSGINIYRLAGAPTSLVGKNTLNSTQKILRLFLLYSPWYKLKNEGSPVPVCQVVLEILRFKVLKRNVWRHSQVVDLGPACMTSCWGLNPFYNMDSLIPKKMLKRQISILDKREKLPQYSPKVQCNAMSSFLFSFFFLFFLSLHHFEPIKCRASLVTFPSKIDMKLYI